MINGERIRQAREIRGFTQTALAERIGVKQPAIAQIEAGKINPTDERFQKIALQTGFPLSFFRRESATEFSLGSLMFRARTRLSKRDSLQAVQLARVIFECIETLEPKIEKRVSLNLPRLTEDPVTAARMTRAALGLAPEAPISNLVHSLEMGGVLVLSIPLLLDDLDAFCAWVGTRELRPVIVVCGKGPGDRLRLSIAHEAAHLVLHYSLVGNREKAESEAMTFAAEFLMPAEIIREEIAPPVTLLSLGKLKERWGVSKAALIRRARDVGIINQNRYTYLNQRLAALGEKTSEKGFVPVEKPRSFSKMAELIYGSPVNIWQMAEDMGMPSSLLRDSLESNSGNSAGLRFIERARFGEREGDNRGVVIEIDRVRRSAKA